MRLRTRNLCVGALGLSLSAGLLAGPRDQARKIYEGLTGVAPSKTVLDTMEGMVEEGRVMEAGLLAIDSGDLFYRKLRASVNPLSNEDEFQRVPLNSFTAMILGFVKFEIPFDEVLYGDHLFHYEADAGEEELPPYSLKNNDHFLAVEEREDSLSKNLVHVKQSEVTDFPPDVAAGILTTQGFGSAYFEAGTNRAALAHVYRGFLCRPIEKLHDNTRSKQWISQDVTTAPGGDPAVYLSRCSGCHAGMDAQRPAMAFWDYTENDGLVYDPTEVPEKLIRNSEENPDGYRIADNKWVNLWVEGKNSAIGWNGETTGEGLKSWGKMIASSDGFAKCWAERALTMTCEIKETNKPEVSLAINQLANHFQADNSYNLKHLYANAAVLCRGE